MTRRSAQQLLELNARLSPRRRRIIKEVAGCRLMTGDHLRNLLPGSTSHSESNRSSRARLLRLDLAALTADGCLHRLDRRVGGVQAGSAGYVYAIGPVGLRLMELWRGRGAGSARTRYEPSIGFQDHALAVTGCVVATVVAAREIGADIEYAVERHAWRSYLGASGARLTLKPDAEVEIQTTDFADHWWLEIDRATERRTAIRRQLDAYVEYYRTGTEQQRGVFPLVAWLTTTEQRAEVLRDTIASLPADGRPLFRVGLIDRAPEVLVEAAGGAA